MLSINIQLADTAKTQIKISINANELVSSLKSIIYSNNTCLQIDSMSLKFGGCVLNNNQNLIFYKIKNDNIIVQEKTNLNDIPNLIISYEPDCISLDNSNEARALMPCGHVISRDSMTEFLQSLVTQRKYEILCPGTDAKNNQCKKKWEYSYCKKIGVLTQEEKNHFENSFSTIFLSESLESKNCPNCQCFIIKPNDLAGDRVQCIICNNKKQGFEFCWICLKKWTNTKEHGKNICGGDFAEIEKILSQCKTKKIGNLAEVPEFRACPKCTTLINHKESCKHIVCSKCKINFCFVCLKLKIDNNWQCGSYSDICSIAPRQNIENLKSILS